MGAVRCFTWVASFVLAVAVLVMACSKSSRCKPGTLALQVELAGDANVADRVTVSWVDPNDPGGMVVTQEAAHLPWGDNLLNLDVAFPSGYPADKLVVFQVRAFSQTRQLGVTVANIHLVPGCSQGFASLGAPALDGGGSRD